MAGETEKSDIKYLYLDSILFSYVGLSVRVYCLRSKTLTTDRWTRGNYVNEI